MVSKANVAGHPIHPMLVVFPVTCFILAFIFDCAYETGTAGSDFVQFSYVLIIAGIATALLAAIPGLIEYSIIVDEYTKQTATSHASLNVLVLILESVNLAYRAHGKHPHHYWKNGWILSLVSVLVLAISGWLGGELAYVHRMGMKPNRSLDMVPGERRGLQVT